MDRNSFVKVFVVFTFTMILSACTGTSVTVTPDPATMKTVFSGTCGAVAVNELPADKVYPPAGNLVPGFVAALKQSGLSDRIYYPTRPDDKADLTLDAKFDVSFDPNMGSNLTKSFFTGLTLFLLEPAFWYNYNYNLAGTINVLKSGNKPATLAATSSAEMSLKFLSLSEVQNLEGETLKKSKDALFGQLLADLDSYCRKR